MKPKIILIAAGVLVVGLFGVLPGFLGAQIEHQIMAHFENIYKTSSNQEIKIQYDRGWLTSKAVIEYKNPPAALEGVVKDLSQFKDNEVVHTFSLQISHGPVIFSELAIALAGFSSQGSVFPVPPEQLKKPFNQIPPYDIRGVLKFDGTLSSVFRVPAFELEIEYLPALENANNGKTTPLAFDEIRVETQTLLKGGEFGVSLLSDDFRVSGQNPRGENFEFLIQGLSFQGNYLTALPYPINYAAGAFSLDRVSFKIGKKGFSLETLQNVDFLARRNGPLIDYHSSIRSGPITYFDNPSKEAEAPAPQVTAIVGETEILNLNSDALVKIFDLLVEYPDSPSPEQKEELEAQVEILLAEGVEHHFPKMEIKTKWGQIRYSHRLVFPSLEGEEPFNALVFGTRVRYSAHLVFDASFVDYLAGKIIQNQLEAAGQTVDEATLGNLKSSTIKNLEAAGYLVKEENGAFSASLETRDGVLYLNGNQMDLMQALQMAS